MSDTDLKTSISINGGPEIPVDLEAVASITDSHVQLRWFVERLERIDAELDDIRADRRDVVAEAKANGFDAKALATIIRRRKMEPHLRDEQDALVQTYEAALGGTSRGQIWGGDLNAAAALPAPSKTSKAMRDALAWMGGQ